MAEHQPIDVLHLIDTTGPGGAETVFTELLARLPRQRYRHHVMLRGEGWVADRVRALGLAPQLLDSKGSFNLAYLYRLVRFIQRRNVKLLHTHLLGSNVYGALAALITRIPMIATFHGSVDVSARERLLDTKFRIISLGARSIVCVSNGLMRDLQNRSTMNSQKLRIIYNGVDESPSSRAASVVNIRNELALPPDARLCISVGNIRPAKGYEYLLEAAAKVANQSWHFLVVGHPKRTLMDVLESRAQALGVSDHVHFLGFREDVAELLEQSDVFLLPSTSEGFSIATVEAMMAGIPVIATRSGGPEEIIEHQRTGILIPPKDPQAIADALIGLPLPQTGDRDAMLQAALASARQRFSMRTMMDQYEELYATLSG